MRAPVLAFVGGLGVWRCILSAGRSQFAVYCVCGFHWRISRVDSASLLGPPGASTSVVKSACLSVSAAGRVVRFALPLVEPAFRVRRVFLFTVKCSTVRLGV